MSIHNEASFQKAKRKGAMAAHSRNRWKFLTEMTKRELAELVVHLGSLATESYDETIQDDELFMSRINEEIQALRDQDII